MVILLIIVYIFYSLSVYHSKSSAGCFPQTNMVGKCYIGIKIYFIALVMHALIGHGFRRIDSTYFYLNLFLYAPTQTVCKMNNVIAKKPLHKLCPLHKTWQGQILLMIFGIKRKPVIDPIIHRLLPYLQ